jgi:hypothetical protein
LPSATLNRT